MKRYGTELSFSYDQGAGYVNMRKGMAPWARNQVVEITSSDGTHLGTLVLDFDAAERLLGIEMLGASNLLQPSFFDEHESQEVSS